MSYDIRLKDPVTNETLTTKAKHLMTGGTYAEGGTKELWLNITYNYSKYYYRIFGDEGIRYIYEMTGAQSIPLLKAGINMLKDDVSNDYWEATEGNAKRALYQLLEMAQLRSDGIWDGD